MWSSSKMTPYMSLTIHYITDDCTLQSKCLETRFILENHTAIVLAENLQTALADWGLQEMKMACITTDNGANIAAAIIKHLGWPCLNCFGHNLTVMKESPKGTTVVFFGKPLTPFNNIEALTK